MQKDTSTFYRCLQDSVRTISHLKRGCLYARGKEMALIVILQLGLAILSSTHVDKISRQEKHC